MPVRTTTSVDWSSQEIPRLGHISFINSLPISHPIDAGHIEVNATLVRGTPAELNSGYRNETIDLGAMSSYYYLSRDDLELMEGLAISSDGPVGSVLFFSKVDPLKLGSSTISVPSSSYTSVNLLKLLMREDWGANPQFLVKDQPDLKSAEIDACLVIGDQALIADSKWQDFSLRADLGNWWKQLTGLPMVFGLWAARRNWARQNDAIVKSVSQSLVQASKMGLGQLLSEVINRASEQTGISKDRLRTYYTEDLNYGFTDQHRRGLNTYKELIEKHGLSDPNFPFEAGR